MGKRDLAKVNRANLPDMVAYMKRRLLADWSDINFIIGTNPEDYIELRFLVTDAGDAIVTYRSQNSRRLKYNVCTMDFDNKYIQSKKNRAKESNDNVLLFCWDTDSYRLLMPKNVTSIVPLSAILRNKR